MARVLNDFAFVGLTERWNESVYAFAQLTRTPVRPVDLMPARVGQQPADRAAVEARYRRLAFDDDAVWRASVWKFEQLLNEQSAAQKQ